MTIVAFAPRPEGQPAPERKPRAKKPRNDEAQAFGEILAQFEAEGRRAFAVVFPGDQDVAGLCAMLEEVDEGGWAVDSIQPTPTGLLLSLVLAVTVLDEGATAPDIRPERSNVTPRNGAGLVPISQRPDTRPRALSHVTSEDPARPSPAPPPRSSPTTWRASCATCPSSTGATYRAS